MKSETENQTEIRLEASRQGILLLRNNSGVAREYDQETGETRFIRYGLGNESKQVNDRVKSSDLIGITPVTIGPQHVGMTLGVFTALEVKKEEWQYTGHGREKAQKAFHDLVQRFGGIAKFITGAEEL